MNSMVWTKQCDLPDEWGQILVPWLSWRTRNPELFYWPWHRHGGHPRQVVKEKPTSHPRLCPTAPAGRQLGSRGWTGSTPTVIPFCLGHPTSNGDTHTLEIATPYTWEVRCCSYRPPTSLSTESWLLLQSETWWVDLRLCYSSLIKQSFSGISLSVMIL